MACRNRSMDEVSSTLKWTKVREVQSSENVLDTGAQHLKVLDKGMSLSAWT